MESPCGSASLFSVLGLGLVTRQGVRRLYGFAVADSHLKHASPNSDLFVQYVSLYTNTNTNEGDKLTLLRESLLRSSRTSIGSVRV
jgi:hypothetical protein